MKNAQKGENMDEQIYEPQEITAEEVGEVTLEEILHVYGEE